MILQKWKENRFLRFIIVLIPIAISLYLFGFTLNYYFYQDDWFNLNISNINTFKEFIEFFKFRDDIIAYRPLEIQTQYLLLRHFFGLNAFALRVINFTLLFFCYLLILNLVKKTIRDKKVAIITGSLWLTSSFQFMNVGMINYHLWGTLSWLINFLLFLQYFEKKKKRFYIASIILYITSLGIWEFAISLPFILTAYLFLLKNMRPNELVKLVLPYYLVSAIYVVIREIYVTNLNITEYQVAFNLESFKSLLWYILWSLNIPEEFKKQVSNNLFILRSEFVKDYIVLIATSFLSAVFFILFGTMYPVFKSIKLHKYINFRLVIFLVCWFGISIFPALLLPNHNFMMYLTLPSIAIYLLISYLLIGQIGKIVICAFMIIWLLQTYNTVSFYKNTYSRQAQRVSYEFAKNIKFEYPYLPSGSILYYYLPFQADQHALMNQNAIKAIYKDDTINIIYSYEDYFRIVKDENNKRPIYIY